MPRLVLLCGRICSGKGSYMQEADKRIVVSDIVKAVSLHTRRDDLQKTMHLDIDIAQSICNHIQFICQHNAKYLKPEPFIVVDGIRQVSIVDYIRLFFPNAEIIWLEVPTEERKRRYEARKDIKDVEPFEIADNKEIELECQRIFDVFKDRLVVVDNF